MKPAEARPLVLSLYRLFRKQGRTPAIAMQMVRNAAIGMSDLHPDVISVDMQLPPGVRSEAAMQSYVAGQYLKVIHLRAHTRPFWRLGFVQNFDPTRTIDWAGSLAWDEVPVPHNRGCPACGQMNGTHSIHCSRVTFVTSRSD